MKQPNFIPALDIDEYLIDEHNQIIKVQLPIYFSEINELEYLNFINEQYELIKLNLDIPHKLAKSIYNNEKLAKFSEVSIVPYLTRYNFFCQLDHFIEREMAKSLSNIEKRKYSIFQGELIGVFSKEIGKHDENRDIEELLGSSSTFNFQTLRAINEVESPLERIRLLKEKKIEYQQYKLATKGILMDGVHQFDQICDLEIEKINLAVDVAEGKDKTELFNGFTNNQIVLIFYYFFKYSGLDPRKDTSVAPIAKFIHLITGKNFTSTNNSEIYKRLLKAPNYNKDRDYNKDRELANDLEKIKPFFKQYQLPEIVKLIDSEIDQCKSEIRFSKNS